MRLTPRSKVRVTWLVTFAILFSLLVSIIHWYAPSTHHQQHHRQKLEYLFVNNSFLSIMNQNTIQESSTSTEKILSLNDLNVHTFYYYWYKNKETDGGYEHWNHKVLPHWQQSINSKYPLIGTAFNPDKGEIGANYWPQRGLYSNYDKETVTEQFLELRDKAKVNVVVVSWWSKGGGDEQSSGIDHVTPLLFEVAEKLGMKIIFHLEPYTGRSALTTKRDLQHIIEIYGHHKALYRSPNHNNLPMCYVYDSYHTPADQWSEILSPNGAHTIRNTDHDHVMISLYLDQQQSQDFIIRSKFDGFYTYFAATRFTYGSTPSNWPMMAEWARSNKLIFIPSVGPGYVDTKIRPWNQDTVRERKGGEYYDEMWKSALKLNVPFISITSYNEWHEGTQIEPAITKNGYSDYSPHNPDYYLIRTAHWIKEYKR